VRTCHNCGYLVPESWDTCKRCHAALKERVPATAAGGRVGITPYAGSPSNTFDPGFSAPVRLGLPEPGTAGAAAPSVPDGGWTWTPSAPAPVRSRSTFRFVPAIVIALVLGLGWFGWQAYQARRDLPPDETREWVDGGGEAYAPAGRGYDVRLPVTPIEHTMTQTVAGMSVSAHIAYSGGDGWDIAVASADVGAIPDGAIDAALSGSAGGFASGTGGEVKSQRRTEHDGHPAVDATVDVGDDFPARVRVIYDGTRAYVLVVHARSGAGVMFDELVQSFRMTSS
jgi:hypothetical protein